MIRRRSFVLNENTGYWEKDGEPHPFVAEVRPDKCLCSKPIRGNLFKAHTLVKFDPKSILKEEDDCNSMYLVKVVPAEETGHEPRFFALCMLDLSLEQQKHLNKHHNVPKKAFIKNAVALHVDFSALEAEMEIDKLQKIDEELLENQ